MARYISRADTTLPTHVPCGDRNRCPYDTVACRKREEGYQQWRAFLQNLADNNINQMFIVSDKITCPEEDFTSCPPTHCQRYLDWLKLGKHR